MGDILSLISLVLPRVPRCRLLALPHPLAVLVCVVHQVLQPVPGVLHTQQTVLRHLGHREKVYNYNYLDDHKTATWK